LISRKREGEELSSREIALLVDGYTQSEVPDYQMSAFAMAVFFKGMTPAKTAALTRAMMASGDCFSHRPGHPPVVGKHSTGGPADLRGIVLDLAGKSRESHTPSWNVCSTMAVPAAVLINSSPPRPGIPRICRASAGGTPTRHGAGEGDRRGDFAVGFDRLVKCGEPIHAGQAVCRIHARTAVDLDMVEAMIEKAVKISVL
jgi:thymidine phosphorylase